MTPIKIVTYVVDDDPQIKDYIADALGDDEDFDILCFNSPVDFKNMVDDAIINKYPIDLVITDVMIPGYDVFDAIKYLSDNMGGTYIIVISAYITKELFHKFMRLRVDDVVEKNGDWIPALRESVNWLKPRLIEKIHTRA